MKRLIVLLGVLLSLIPGVIEAGQANLNSRTKSYALTYTYAVVPGADSFLRNEPRTLSSSDEGLSDSGRKRMEEELSQILGVVNVRLGVATRGNARIASLTYVRDASSADLIIAIDSPSNRGGMAVPLAGSGDGRPGHFYLYYDYLKSHWKSDPEGVVNTITHELCHYFFGLPDEYRDSSAEPQCPLTPGQGCLMDNYWLRGSSGRLCDDSDHNTRAPAMVFLGRREDSCLSVLRQFYRSIGVPFDENDGQSIHSSNWAVERPTTSFDSADRVTIGGNRLTLVESKVLASLIDRHRNRPRDEAVSQVFRALRDASEQRGHLDDRSLLALHDIAVESVDRDRRPVRIRTESSQVLSSRRGTLLIAPSPVQARVPGADPDHVATQAGDHQSYREMRDLGIHDFVVLTDSTQVQLLTGAKDGFQPVVAPSARRPNENIDLVASIVSSQTRENQIEAIFAELGRSVEEDKVEHVVVFVPPGGLPVEVEPHVARLRRRFLDGDAPKLRRIRIDLALINTPRISSELRDLACRTHGAILSVSDVDEIGAISQRLALGQSQGSWAIIPDQGILRVPATDLAARSFAVPEDESVLNDYARAVRRLIATEPGITRRHEPAGEPESKLLFRRMLSARTEASPIHFLEEDQGLGRPRVSAAGTIDVSLKPFYVDGNSTYQLVVGLSQKLEGLDRGSIELARKSDRLADLPVMSFQDERTAGDRATPLVGLERDLMIDPDRTTERTLVYHLEPLSKRGLGAGWYTPVLRLPRRIFGRFIAARFVPTQFHEGKIHYTFSVGVLNPGKHVEVSVVQMKTIGRGEAVTKAGGKRRTDDHGDAFLGTLDSREDTVVIQAEVRAGVPVAGAKVLAYTQRLEENSTSPIRTISLALQDDGVGDDLHAGDGIYTGQLGLSRDDRKAAEYRIFVEASTVEGGELVSTSGSSPFVRETTERSMVPRFQRASSYQFRLPAVGER